MKTISKSLVDTEYLAAKLLRGLKPDAHQAVVLGLVGDLGSGKTTFVQALARQLGVAEKVTSPTFVIEKNYKLRGQQGEPSLESSEGSPCWSQLIHIDAYRLAKPEEMLALHWKEIIAQPKNLIVIEWAERLASIVPRETHWLNFKFIDENTREIGLA